MVETEEVGLSSCSTAVPLIGMANRYMNRRAVCTTSYSMVAGMTDSLCEISDLTQEIHLLFWDQAAWTWTESNPTIESVPRFQRYG